MVTYVCAVYSIRMETQNVICMQSWILNWFHRKSLSNWWVIYCLTDDHFWFDNIVTQSHVFLVLYSTFLSRRFTLALISVCNFLHSISNRPCTSKYSLCMDRLIKILCITMEHFLYYKLYKAAGSRSIDWDSRSQYTTGSSNSSIWYCDIGFWKMRRFVFFKDYLRLFI